MGKSEKDMCPFSYWRAREANSEPMQEGHLYGKKDKRTSVLLTVGEQERKIQNAQVLSISSVLLTVGEQERKIQNVQVLSISSKSRDKKK